MQQAETVPSIVVKLIVATFVFAANVFLFWYAWNFVLVEAAHVEHIDITSALTLVVTFQFFQWKNSSDGVKLTVINTDKKDKP